MFRITLLVAIALFSLPLSAQDNGNEGENNPPTIEIGRVLSLGPLPVDTDRLSRSGHAGAMQRALVGQLDEGELPAAGGELSIFGQSASWGEIEPAEFAEESALMLWWFQLEADRFVRGHLKIEGFEKPVVYVDGRLIESGDDGYALDLRNGSHGIWIVHAGASAEGDPALRWTGREAQDRVSVSLRPERRVSAQLLTNAETVGDMAISPDGRYLALAFERRDEPADADIQRLEIRDLQTDRIVRHWTGERPAALAWSPDGRSLAIQQGDSLWLLDRESGRARALLLEHEGLGSWRWHPDSDSIIFSWTDKDDSETDKRRRLRALEDRWAGFRDNSQIHQVDIESGLVRPLTAADRSVTLHDVEGDRLLLSQRSIDYAEPPHSLFRIFELNLDGLEERDVVELRQFDDIRFAEDGYWLLAGPGLPMGDGKTLGEERAANEYDTQLYLLAADGASATSVSRDFDPAFSGIERLADGDLLLSAVDGERSALVHFDGVDQVLTRVDIGVEVMEGFVASRTSPPTVVVRGSDATAPQRVHRVGIDGGIEILFNSRASSYADVVFGEVRDWSFTNADGEAIEGRYYLPPDFDPENEYPLIVYYYGGTMPVNRQFTGRYPFNLWAANGYVIYVLQPRGTIGYGQDFSARHVNAWGEYTADDIIEGTQKFVAAHEFVDGERIGNIGASYGGFMTMYLATKTDLFAASISHAGISALTSYWGEGWWGYGYSGIASRGSFPWNNRELYVEQSPVYNADKITTPMLLLHGDSDTNVPPGESHNMYTALKLLGREVEMVEFPGEDHWILDREKRYVWWDTMLAWYDKWLKDEPQWWQYLYPEATDE
ncbi:S9 family peptidase [Wenzhouxiangella sp. XN201]|uniref:prolyl oligopeptidase family serine peptidase n=1 Tax=Wenzhouxiangella sp. XN201 TaxID=2710755 RepID=UPI0013CCE93F|nr:S9 family peptidase [Wenzhouxiangella sp. XN201]